MVKHTLKSVFDHFSTSCMKGVITKWTFNIIPKVNIRCLNGSKNRQRSSKRFLILGPNYILVTLRWDDGRSSGHENDCR